MPPLSVCCWGKACYSRSFPKRETNGRLQSLPDACICRQKMLYWSQAAASTCAHCRAACVLRASFIRLVDTGKEAVFFIADKICLPRSFMPSTRK